MSNDIKKENIYQRMHKVMLEVSAIQKEEKKVNNQYTFVSHDRVTAKLRGSFVKNGIVQLVDVTNHSQDGNRTIVDIRVDFINIDKPDDRVSVNHFGYGVDNQDKGVGKAISYAVKYALLKCFALETGDDCEKDNINHNSGNKIIPISLNQKLKIQEYLKKLNLSNNDIKPRLAEYGAKSVEGLSLQNANLIIEKLKAHDSKNETKKTSKKVTYDNPFTRVTKIPDDIRAECMAKLEITKNVEDLTDKECLMILEVANNKKGQTK